MPLVLASVASAFGCQLLYDKNDLTIATGGDGGATTTTQGGGGAGAATSTGSTSMGGGGATTTSMGGGGTTTSSAEGGGGAGGMTTSMGGGGTGGTSSAGGGGTGGTTTSTTTTTTTTMDCSTERLFVLGTSPTSVLCAASDSTGSTWTSTTSATAFSNARPAAGLLDAQTGVGVFYQEAGATMKGPLRAVELVNGTCGAPANVLTVVTKAAPGVALLGGKVQALFQGAEGAGSDHPFSTAWSPASWSTPDDIDMNVFSPAPAAIATSGAEMLAVYGGGDDNLYRVRYAAGAWQPPAVSFKNAAMSSEQANKTLTPAAAGLDAGGWLVVFQDKAAPGTQLRWLRGDAAANMESKVLATALSPSPVALAGTPGGAVLAYRGTDNKVYASVYASAGDAWSPIVEIPGATTTSSPAVANGVCTHDAELVYTDAGGVVRHSFLEAGTWSMPVAVDAAATGMTGVAIAATPRAR